jgi:hypothetical protein
LAKSFVDDFHAIYPVNLKLERGRERERYGRQKKDQNNIEERSAALANYTALDKNVMSCTEIRCQNQISHYYIVIHHPF